MTDKPLGTIITWGMLVIFLAVIFTVYFKGQDKGFMSKAADSILSLEKYLPLGTSKKFDDYTTVPEKAAQEQSNFKKDIDDANQAYTNYGKTPCMFPTVSFSELNDVIMQISNDGSGISLKISKQASEGLVAMNNIPIENANICVINPQNFYSCYLWKDFKEKNCDSQLYTDVSSVIVSKNAIEINKRKYSLYPYLLKIEGRYCFLPITSTPVRNFFIPWGSCGAYDQYSLNDKCINELKNNHRVPICISIHQ